MEYLGTWQGVVSAVSAGLLLDVEFNQAVNRHPGYMYSGMRGRLVAASFSGDEGEVRLKVDLQPFREFNRMSERRMYCDAKALQADKARGKGIYPDDHCATLVVDAGHPVAGLLRPLARQGYRLYDEYRGAARDSDLSYPRWLEARALGAEPTPEGFASQPVAGQEIALPEFITVGELAAKLGVKTLPVILALTKCGIMATVNQTLDHTTAALVLIDLGFKVKPQGEASFAALDEVPVTTDPGEVEASRVPPRPPVQHTEEPWPEFRIGIISQADYERARLCVNACAGRDPQQMRQMADQASRGAVDGIRALEQERDAAVQRRDRLEEMRDSVWSVLQRLRDDLRRDDPQGHFDIVCDALAEVEEMRGEPGGSRSAIRSA